MLINFHQKFPNDLGELTIEVAKKMGYEEYRPEASTVNYYSHSRYLMGGHVDDSEEAVHVPISYIIIITIINYF